ncbi:MAG: hypothetical protein DRJ49_02455 [Thermoprotei archaeon]|nr:MAG: hypothetical protein DRJ49_02455 [Thermoprotei archaeon]
MNSAKRKRLRFRKLTDEDKSKILNIIFNHVEEEIKSKFPEDHIRDLVIKIEIIGEYFPTVNVEVDIEIKSFRKIDTNKLLEEVVDRALEKAETEIRKLLEL